MSYPRNVVKFKKWAQAMVDGATVDKPDYGKTQSGSVRGPRKRAQQRRKRRFKRRWFRAKKTKAD